MQSTGELGPHRGRPVVAAVCGRDGDCTRTNPDTGPRHSGLVRWNVREHFEQPVTELRVDPELLVYDGPQHPIGTPCLLKR